MARRLSAEGRGEVPDQPSLASRLDGVLYHDFCPWANRLRIGHSWRRIGLGSQEWPEQPSWRRGRSLTGPSQW